MSVFSDTNEGALNMEQELQITETVFKIFGSIFL